MERIKFFCKIKKKKIIWLSKSPFLSILNCQFSELCSDDERINPVYLYKSLGPRLNLDRISLQYSFGHMTNVRHAETCGQTRHVQLEPDKKTRVERLRFVFAVVVKVICKDIDKSIFPCQTLFFLSKKTCNTQCKTRYVIRDKLKRECLGKFRKILFRCVTQIIKSQEKCSQINAVLI